MDIVKHAGFYIKIINVKLEKFKNNYLSKYDITSQQFSIVMFLLKHQGELINQKRIEEEFNFSKPTISGLIDRLVEKGFVYREVDKDDVRSNIIKPSLKAVSLEKPFKDELAKMECILTKGFSEEEKNNLIDILDKLYENIKEIGEQND